MGSLNCPERQAAAAHLGAERRRLFVIATLVSLATPLLPYLTGTWETAWYALAATFWPIAVRTALFLIGCHGVAALVMLPLSYYSGYALPRAYDLGRQTRSAWA